MFARLLVRLSFNKAIHTVHMQASAELKEFERVPELPKAREILKSIHSLKVSIAEDRDSDFVCVNHMLLACD